VKPLLFAFHFLLLISCQSNVYQIDGYARDFKDGDTICLHQEIDGDGTVFITQVVDGKFSFSGETNTSTFCQIYTIANPKNKVSFFLEPARITVELSLAPERNRVSGTIINNTWQQLNDSICLLGKEAVNTVMLMARDNTEHLQRAKTIDSLHRRMSDCILNTARRNSDNVLGRYIRQNYKAPEFH
jgi:hypothetical protein